MKIALIIALGLSAALAGCAGQNASDPSYGTMFKQHTRDTINGRGFWDSSTPKTCMIGAGGGVCMAEPPAPQPTPTP
jgi:hypothetical protein